MLKCYGYGTILALLSVTIDTRIGLLVKCPFYKKRNESFFSPEIFTRYICWARLMAKSYQTCKSGSSKKLFKMSSIYKDVTKNTGPKCLYVTMFKNKWFVNNHRQTFQKHSETQVYIYIHRAIHISYIISSLLQFFSSCCMYYSTYQTCNRKRNTCVVYIRYKRGTLY